MGLIHAELELRNVRDMSLASFKAHALVDTGSLYLCIPQHVATQLKLAKFDQKEVTTADGTLHLCAYVGPLQVKFDNRSCLTGALVRGDEVLLGTIPMEDMDVLINPAKQQLIVNPGNPNIAASVAK